MLLVVVILFVVGGDGVLFCLCFVGLFNRVKYIIKIKI